MDSVGVELDGLSTEGGEAWGYLRTSGDLKVIHAWLYGETGWSMNMFYFEGEQIFLAVDVQHKYNRPIYWDESARVSHGDDQVFDPEQTKALTRHTYFDDGAAFYHEDLGQMGGDGIRALPDSDLVELAGRLRQRLLSKHAVKRSLSAKGMVAIDPGVEHRKNCPALRPDVQLGGITLLDDSSATAVTGGVTAEMLIEDHGDMPRVHFRSSDGSQCLTLYFHYGGVLNAFSEFKVSRTATEPVVKDLHGSGFVSGKGIALGMNLNDAIGRLGGCFRSGEASNGNRLLTYGVTGSDDPFLRQFGYPSYYAMLEFANDQLIEYRFGFQYP
ncbi:MAG: hypothetical protein KA941_03950 [Flavobacteriales bacterium]|nr:hypothetical protein [Flavobacteriales bacterium]